MKPRPHASPSASLNGSAAMTATVPIRARFTAHIPTVTIDRQPGRYVLFTPAVAEELLTRNEKNRTIRWGYVKKLANAMRRGEWRITHQGISIDSDGNVLDGQNRLWAIVESQVSVVMVLTEDADPADFGAIDYGMKRTTNDVLRVNRNLVEVAKAIYILNDSVRLTPTPPQVQHYIDVFGETIEALHERCSTRGKVFGVAAARAVVVLRAMSGHRSYAFEMYAGLNLNRPGDLSPNGQAFYKQIADGHKKPKGSDLAARMWYATDPGRASNQKLLVKDVNEAMKAIRDVSQRIAPQLFTEKVTALMDFQSPLINQKRGIRPAPKGADQQP